MSNDELKSVLSGAYQPEKILPMPLQSLIVCELNDRSIKKSSNPHWWIGIVSIALTAIGVWIAYQSLSHQNEQHDSRAIEFDEYLNSEKRLEKSVQGFEELRKEKKQEQETSDGLLHDQDRASPLENLEQGTSEPKELEE
ncbi:hypothetical protein [Nitrosomonas sp.]|uniref:hypothetical protein n=1 Tax=Nitrosomonas sp. TaxID=42353 RepID=UPI00283DB8CC|nr:hypothetical protein [Nitrosomonas sp.]MDR4513644.1 hypothetical protein [Nitrosomonas sp.]